MKSDVSLRRAAMTATFVGVLISPPAVAQTSSTQVEKSKPPRPKATIIDRSDIQPGKLQPALKSDHKFLLPPDSEHMRKAVKGQVTGRTNDVDREDKSKRSSDTQSPSGSMSPAGDGGDPKNVTIAGESAGGWSVLAMLPSPAGVKQGAEQRDTNEPSRGANAPSNQRLLDMYALPPDLEYMRTAVKGKVRRKPVPSDLEVFGLEAELARLRREENRIMSESGKLYRTQRDLSAMQPSLNSKPSDSYQSRLRVLMQQKRTIQQHIGQKLGEDYLRS